MTKEIILIILNLYLIVDSFVKVMQDHKKDRTGSMVLNIVSIIFWTVSITLHFVRIFMGLW